MRRHAHRRPQPRRRLEGLIGFFVNTLVLRARPATGAHLPRAAGPGAGDHAWAPTPTRTCPSRSWWRSCSPSATSAARPLFQVMFALQNALPAGPDCRGLAAAAPRRRRAPRPSSTSTLALAETPDGLRGVRSSTAPTCSSAATVAAPAGALPGACWRAWSPTPDARLADLPLLADRRSASSSCGVERHRPPPTRRQRCVHQLVEAQAARTPDAVAVAGSAGARSPTASSTPAPTSSPTTCARWASAPRRASASAWSARSSWSWPCWPSSRPAAPTSRSTRPTPASAWPSCWRTPARPACCSPPRHAAPDRCPPRGGAPGAPRRPGRRDGHRRRRPRRRPPSPRPPPTTWPTSSTPPAPPAGPRASWCPTPAWPTSSPGTSAHFGLTPERPRSPRSPAPPSTPPSGSCGPAWPAAASRARPATRTRAAPRGPARLAAWRRGSPSASSPTPLAEAVLALDWPAGLPALRLLLTGGDAAAPARSAGRAPASTLVNLYGPTEATVVATCYARRPGGRPTAAAPPIGRPIANTQVYVLDAPAAAGARRRPGRAVRRRRRAWRAATSAGPASPPSASCPTPSAPRPARASTAPATWCAGAADGDAGVPGPPRPPGEAARLPHRAGRGRGRPGRATPAVREAVVRGARGRARGDKRLVAYVVHPCARSP